MCLHALACAAFFSRAARNGRTRPPAPPPDSAFQPRANATGLPGRSVGGAARRCLRQWGTESGRLLPGRGGPAVAVAASPCLDFARAAFAEYAYSVSCLICPLRKPFVHRLCLLASPPSSPPPPPLPPSSSGTTERLPWITQSAYRSPPLVNCGETQGTRVLECVACSSQ